MDTKGIEVMKNHRPISHDPLKSEMVSESTNIVSRSSIGPLPSCYIERFTSPKTLPKIQENIERPKKSRMLSKMVTLHHSSYAFQLPGKACYADSQMTNDSSRVSGKEINHRNVCPCGAGQLKKAKYACIFCN